MTTNFSLTYILFLNKNKYFFFYNSKYFLFIFIKMTFISIIFIYFHKIYISNIKKDWSQIWPKSQPLWLNNKKIINYQKEKQVSIVKNQRHSRLQEVEVP